MNKRQRVFYAPAGETPKEITGRVFRHPVTGDQIHNPKVDLALDILPLEAELPPSDSRLFNMSDKYSRAKDVDVVRMTWSSTAKPALPALSGRLQELRAKAQQVGDSNSIGFTREALDIAVVYKASGGPGPWVIYKADGEWVELEKEALDALVADYAYRLEEVMQATRVHSEQLRAYVEAGDLGSLLDHDLEQGWPV